MFFFFKSNIPQALLDQSQTDEDINIIIGENGSGKSSVLNEIAIHFSRPGSDVIAIANTIYDKFSRNKYTKILRAASGRSLPSKTIKNALINLANDDLKRMRNVANTLTYIGFDPVISFKLEGINKNFREEIISSNLIGDTKENLLHFLNRYVHETIRDGDMLSINFNYSDFKDIKNAYLVTLFMHEKELKQLKLISSITIFLRKEGKDVPLLQASSGELTLVTTLVYITSMISRNSVILIDEPENSLHPKWQIDYVKKLYELFYYYQPKVIVATHSPLILNGAEISAKKINVFKGSKGKFELHQNTTTNVEEIYQDFFDITTPENRYISEAIVEKMNLLSEKEIDEKQFEEFIQEIKDKSYDDKQKVALDGVLELGKEVVKEIE